MLPLLYRERGRDSKTTPRHGPQLSVGVGAAGAVWWGWGRGCWRALVPRPCVSPTSPRVWVTPGWGSCQDKSGRGRSPIFQGLCPGCIICNLLGVIKEVWAPRMRSACVHATSVLSRLCGLGHLGFRFHVYEEEMILPYLAGVSTCTWRLSESLLKSYPRGAWVAQSVERPTSARSRSRGLWVRAPRRALSSEPGACFRFCVSLSLCPSPVHALSLSVPKINKR